ncbi:MAG: SCO family protein [Nibricoccus sp.]
MKLRFFLFLAAILLCLSPARMLAGEKVYDVTGVVRAPLDQEGQVSIAHDDIPGLMPAMTMRFDVMDSKEAAPLKAGDRVRFWLHVKESEMRASDFIVTGAEKLSGAEQKSKATSTRLHEGDSLPEFSLVTQSGKAITAANLRGHFAVLTFIFTRCPRVDYCPAMASRFGELQNAIKAEPKLTGRVQLLSISLDPEYDTAEILKSYGEAQHADFAVWQFLTGSHTETSRLTKAFSVFAERNGVTIDHTLCTALIDPSGRVTHIWRGNGWKAEEVLKALNDH